MICIGVEMVSIIPTLVFKGHPPIFHAFTICIIFAFSAAFCALMILNYPKIARFCGYYSMASALSLLIWVVSS
ncbi:hypothetical protein E1A91_D13G100100v1 [Gossypium mustelinum]|uniref:Uncharacterized protein n=2 Tax=Gossypium TaxID=3633 RepID=A0A5J5NK67_GOSBA|nr:hypothetical protein ES319_D13G097300v1 [Gossypium barbadense]TYI46330.1 hypothetical protein E1A91_D13G100100v1 [Gossypium mustelinum]